MMVQVMVGLQIYQEDWVRVIKHPINMGNGAAVKTGIRHSKSRSA